MKLGVSTWSLLNIDLNSAVRAIGDAGFEYIELWGEVPHAYHDWADKKRLKDTLSTYDMILTLHAPFTGLNLASPFEPVKGAVAKTLTDFVRFAVQLDASIVTFHPGGVYNQALVAESSQNASRMLRGLVKECGGRLAIAIENQGTSKSKYEFPLASTLDALGLLLEEVEGVRFTLDTGHAHVSGLDPMALAERFGPRLAEIHLHDNAGGSDDHLIPGEGTASLQKLLDKVSGSDLLVCLELNPHRYSQDQVMSASSRISKDLVKRASRS